MIGSHEALDQKYASYVLRVDSCFTNVQLRKIRFPLHGREIEQGLERAASNRCPRNIPEYHCRNLLWFRRMCKTECTRCDDLQREV